MVNFKATKGKSVREWAEELGCTQETLRRAIRRHQLLATKDPLGVGTPYTILPADMASFLAKRATS